MKQESLISVVMPVYNGGKYLREAIESILNQTYGNFEFLIINDGSSDNTDEIIRSYTDRRIVYLQNDGNCGLVYTLNYGISVAKGEYIARMDADDISEPTRFEKQIEVFEKDPELGLCGTWAKIIGTKKVFKVETENERIKCGLFFTNQFIHPSIMFSKTQLTKSGYKYEEKNFTAEDYALWINLSQKIKMQNIPECLLQYRVHALQISTASSEKQKQRTNQIYLEQIIHFLKYEPTIKESKVHLLFLNHKYKIQGYSDLQSIYNWTGKLIALNNKCGYYNPQIFNNCIKENIEKRFIYQNYGNNNPLFLSVFYFTYLKHNVKLSSNFHIKFIVKCLIFYKRFKNLKRFNT